MGMTGVNTGPQRVPMGIIGAPTPKFLMGPREGDLFLIPGAKWAMLLIGSSFVAVLGGTPPAPRRRSPRSFEGLLGSLPDQ